MTKTLSDFENENIETQFYFLAWPNGEYPFSIARDQTIATDCSGELRTRSCVPADKSCGPEISIPSNVPETWPFLPTTVYFSGITISKLTCPTGFGATLLPKTRTAPTEM